MSFFHVSQRFIIFFFNQVCCTKADRLQSKIAKVGNIIGFIPRPPSFVLEEVGNETKSALIQVGQPPMTA